MKNNRVPIALIVVLIVVVLALAMLGPMLFRREAAKVQTQSQVGKPAQVSAKGIVESEEEAELSSEVVGTIDEMKVDVGDQVKKGQVLVLIDNSMVMAKEKASAASLTEARERLRELEAGYRAEDVEIARSKARRAEAVHERAKDDYERMQRLYRKEAATLIDLENAREKMRVSAEELGESRASAQKYQSGVRREEIEQSRATVERSVAEVAYYRSLLKDYTIYSPLDGVVADRFKKTSEMVDVGTPVLKLVNPNMLRIRAELEETDIGKVKEGQTVEFYTDAYNKVYRGTVYKVFPSVKRKQQRTFDPMASFDINTQGIYIRDDDLSGLKEGMTVTVRFLP